MTLIFYSLSEINVWLVYLFNFKHFFIPFEALFYFQASECICFDNVTVSKLSQTKVFIAIKCPGNTFDKCGKTGTNEYVLYEKSIIFIYFYYTWNYQEMRVGIPLTGLAPPYVLRLCQVRTYISNTIWRGLLFVQCFELRGKCSSCWQ